MVKVFLVICCLCFCFIAKANGEEQVDFNEPACKTVSKWYLRDLRSSMEGCSQKLWYLKAEISVCNKHIKNFSLACQFVGTNEKEIKRLEKDCRKERKEQQEESP